MVLFELLIRLTQLYSVFKARVTLENTVTNSHPGE